MIAVNEQIIRFSLLWKDNLKQMNFINLKYRLFLFLLKKSVAFVSIKYD